MVSRNFTYALLSKWYGILFWLDGMIWMGMWWFWSSLCGAIWSIELLRGSYFETNLTISTATMTVVHFTKISAMYPSIVISSLIGWLENLIFTILYTFFGVWPKNHYMSLQRFTMGRMPSFAKVVCSTIALRWFLEVVAVPWPLLHRVSLGE
jgi:hypothetical protein